MTMENATSSSHSEEQLRMKKMAMDRWLSVPEREASVAGITDEQLLFELAMTAGHNGLTDAHIARIAADRVQSPDYLLTIAMCAYDYEASEAAVACLDDDCLLIRILSELEQHTEKWALDRENGDNITRLEQELKIDVSDKIREVSLLVEPALMDPGDHLLGISAKENYIRRLAENPEVLLTYVQREKDGLSLAMTADVTMDRCVLEHIASCEGDSWIQAARKQALSKLEVMETHPEEHIGGTE